MLVGATFLDLLKRLLLTWGVTTDYADLALMNEESSRMMNKLGKEVGGRDDPFHSSCARNKVILSATAITVLFTDVVSGTHNCVLSDRCSSHPRPPMQLNSLCGQYLLK